MQAPADPRGEKDWFPYQSKVMFLLNTADNLPRLRISDSQMKLFLFILKECGVQNVPSFAALRKLQSDLRTSGSAIPTNECRSVQDKVFYTNNFQKVVANDWNNPLIRSFIRVYCEKPENGIVSELWHARKWCKDMDRSKLSPMYAAADGQHYFVDELAQLKTGKLVIPLRWYTKGGKQWITRDGVRLVFADAYEVSLDEEGRATVLDTNVVEIAAGDLQLNFLSLQRRKRVPPWSDATTAARHNLRMPNPKRAKANGRAYYVAMLIFFADDVSGNLSKSWNKHWVVYFTHGNLPRSLHQQEAHKHFVSTSQHATVAEQFAEVRRLIAETEVHPIVVRDPESREETLIELAAFTDASDNPMQAEICSCKGDKGNFPCRKCHVGGTQIEKRTNEIYESFFHAGEPRDWQDVLSAVNEQLDLACAGMKGALEAHQTASGIQDPYAQFWIDKILADHKTKLSVAKQTNPRRPLAELKAEVYQELRDGVEGRYDEIYNPAYLLNGHDPTQDTPVEILHTILLGVGKYIWYYSHDAWNPPTKQVYAQRLQASDINGLTLPPIRAAYIMQYAGSLIGRQLKTVIQMSVFHVHDLVDGKHFAAWRAVAQLAALLWVPEIDNMELYCEDLSIAVANVLDAFCEIDPSKMIMKFKLHLLPHLVEDVQRFGPLVGVATENFESFNAVFRAASILSNHRAPSRDIAYQLADQEGARHRILGGWWIDETTGAWVQAGSAVRQYIKKHKNLQKLLGWTVHDVPKPGLHYHSSEFQS
ncbi:hypothetical protein MKEN_01169200 [Mycena kentingensis (nom. inval.)]|nr:hypothetical protein MKEN_01169200 [Mycena kentingensis (nom. inval.)]